MTASQPGRETGNAKEERKKEENTNTNTPSPERANPERAREKKKRTDETPTRGGGGEKVRSLQVLRDDQSRYPPKSWVASLAVDSSVGHCPLQIIMTRSRQVRKSHRWKFYISSDDSHTHTPRSSGPFWGPGRWDESEDEKEMEMRLRWEWDDNLLTRTRDGESKRRKEKRKTPTPAHLAQSGQTLKGQGTRKGARTTGQTLTRGRGADGSAWHNLQGESQTYLGTRRAQTWPREEARMR